MYAFPKIEFPDKLIKLAKSKDMEPDLIYCLKMLETTGIVAVPGSGIKFLIIKRFWTRRRFSSFQNYKFNLSKRKIR